MTYIFTKTFSIPLEENFTPAPNDDVSHVSNMKTLTFLPHSLSVNTLFQP